MPKISLDALPLDVLSCLHPITQSVWDRLPDEEQDRELAEAQTTLAWQRGPGKSWCEYVDNTLMTEAAALRYYQRQLLGNTLSSGHFIEYLCAEHGLTLPQARNLTGAQAIEILRAACRKKDIPASPPEWEFAPSQFRYRGASGTDFLPELYTCCKHS
jgi:hypothetical protein